ncbi:putative membrane protein YuiD [Bienertia sinuspersici]
MNSTAIKPSSSTCFNQKLFNPKNNPYQRAISFFSISIFEAKPLKRAICISCKLPINIPLNPFSLLAPILQSIKNFTSKAAKFKWVSYLQDPSIDDIISSCNNRKTQILHNGGLGMALLTVQSTARDRFNPFVATLAANPTFISGLLAWFLAQSTKVLLNFFVERKWDLSFFCASGGMPSSHSALCTAMTTSVAICHGVADSLFPVCLGFSLIVMYDATGVRRHAGMQAQV